MVKFNGNRLCFLRRKLSTAMREGDKKTAIDLEKKIKYTSKVINKRKKKRNKEISNRNLQIRNKKKVDKINSRYKSKKKYQNWLLKFKTNFYKIPVKIIVKNRQIQVLECLLKNKTEQTICRIAGTSNLDPIIKATDKYLNEIKIKIKFTGKIKMDKEFIWNSKKKCCKQSCKPIGPKVHLDKRKIVFYYKKLINEIKENKNHEWIYSQNNEQTINLLISDMMKHNPRNSGTKEVLIIHGQGRSGKTTLLRELYQVLKYKKSTIKRNTRLVCSLERVNNVVIIMDCVCFNNFKGFFVAFLNQIIENCKIPNLQLKQFDDTKINNSLFLINEILKVSNSTNVCVFLLVDNLDIIFERDPKNTESFYIFLKYKFNKFIKIMTLHKIKLAADINYAGFVLKPRNRVNLAEVLNKKLSKVLNIDDLHKFFLSVKAVNYMASVSLKWGIGCINDIFEYTKTVMDEKIKQLDTSDSNNLDNFIITASFIQDVLKIKSTTHGEIFERANLRIQIYVYAIYEMITNKKQRVGYEELNRNYNRLTYVLNIGIGGGYGIQEVLNFLVSYDFITIELDGRKIKSVFSVLKKKELFEVLSCYGKLRMYF